MDDADAAESAVGESQPLAADQHDLDCDSCDGDLDSDWELTDDEENEVEADEDDEEDHEDDDFQPHENNNNTSCVLFLLTCCAALLTLARAL